MGRVEEVDRDEGDARGDLMACVNARKIAAKMAAKSRSRSQRGPDMSHAEIDGKVQARAEGPDTSEDRLKRKTKGEGPERRQRHSKVPRAPGKGETKEEGERKTNSERRRPDKRHPSYSLKPPIIPTVSMGKLGRKHREVRHVTSRSQEVGDTPTSPTVLMRAPEIRARDALRAETWVPHHKSHTALEESQARMKR